MESSLIGSGLGARSEAGLSDLELSDTQVIERIRAGESFCFEILMRRHNRRVFRATRAIMRHDDEAEDVMQEAYVRAYEHLADRARLRLQDIVMGAFDSSAERAYDFHLVRCDRVVHGVFARLGIRAAHPS